MSHEPTGTPPPYPVSLRDDLLPSRLGGKIITHYGGLVVDVAGRMIANVPIAHKGLTAPTDGGGRLHRLTFSVDYLWQISRAINGRRGVPVRLGHPDDDDDDEFLCGHLTCARVVDSRLTGDLRFRPDTGPHCPANWALRKAAERPADLALSIVMRFGGVERDGIVTPDPEVTPAVTAADLVDRGAATPTPKGLLGVASTFGLAPRPVQLLDVDGLGLTWLWLDERQNPIGYAPAVVGAENPITYEPPTRC